jgi:hypothetical protein
MAGGNVSAGKQRRKLQEERGFRTGKGNFSAPIIGHVRIEDSKCKIKKQADTSYR